MLYITTRSDRDAFTAHRTLLTERAPDNGLFLPMKFPQIDEEAFSKLVSDSFEKCVANIVNLFYSSELTQWDVGFCIGRNSVRVFGMNPKICCVELWHNPGNGFNYILNGLFRRVFGDDQEAETTEWFRLVVKIAVICGIYSELCRQNIISFGDSFDLSIPADDFSYPIAALYAAELGLPIGDLICNCVQTSEVWNMLHRGELSVGNLSDPLQASLERLVLLRIGNQAVRQLCDRRTLKLVTEEHERLKEGLFCVVSGKERAQDSLVRVFSNSGRILTPLAALCIAGLGDYRAKMGESKFTLVIEEDSPAMYLKEIEKVTSITSQQIEDYIKE